MTQHAYTESTYDRRRMAALLATETAALALTAAALVADIETLNAEAAELAADMQQLKQEIELTHPGPPMKCAKLSKYRTAEAAKKIETGWHVTNRWPCSECNNWHVTQRPPHMTQTPHTP